MQNNKNEILAYALEIGFSMVRTTDLTPLISEFTAYKSWIDSGFHSEMKFMENNLAKRENPKLFFEKANSAIVLAVNYYQDFYENWGKEFKIARYAFGQDYHKVIEKKLKKLCAFIKENYGSDSKYSVDTSALMEKALAKKAGIGWQGKNSTIISEEYGSWIFLAVILTELELEPDAPIADKCGECNKCIKACPTAAIKENRMIDCNKCIAYWTIEAKTAPPLELKNNFDGWIFGCYVCQNVCPYNSHPKQTEIPEFIANPEFKNLTKEKILNMSEEEFKRIFDGSPIKRAKLEGLKRNIA